MPTQFTELYSRIDQLLQRVVGYIKAEPLQVFIELAVIWAIVYIIVRFLRGTRGAWAIKGVALILVAGTLTVQILGEGLFERLNFLYSNFLAVASIMLLIVFQPELRRALVRIGETQLFNKQTGLRKARVVEEILGSVEYLAHRKIGALIAIERKIGLRGIIEHGTSINAEVSNELLQTIFWPNSALHDLGVVIQGDRLMAAGVQFPLAEAEAVEDPNLGSRHRAAIGLSHESDALIVVVSEETGKISLAERGKLERGLSIDELRTALTKGMTSVSMSDELNESKEASDTSKQDTASQATTTT